MPGEENGAWPHVQRSPQGATPPIRMASDRSAAVAVLVDDPLGDLDDGPLVIDRGLAKEAIGLFGRALLVDHEQAGCDVDVCLIVGFLLSLFDHGSGRNELWGAAHCDGDLCS